MRTGDEPMAFEYAVIRAVPRVEREEFVNVGVVLYCQAGSFLDAAIDVDADKVRAIDDAADIEAISHAAESFLAADRADDGARGLGEVFRWLTSPRSTVIQTGPVHTGLTGDPALELDHLMHRLVR